MFEIQEVPGGRISTSMSAQVATRLSVWLMDVKEEDEESTPSCASQRDSGVHQPSRDSFFKPFGAGWQRRASVEEQPAIAPVESAAASVCSSDAVPACRPHKCADRRSRPASDTPPALGREKSSSTDSLVAISEEPAPEASRPLLLLRPRSQVLSRGQSSITDSLLPSVPEAKDAPILSREKSSSTDSFKGARCSTTSPDNSFKKKGLLKKMGSLDPEAPSLEKLCSVGATGMGMPFLSSQKSPSTPSICSPGKPIMLKVGSVDPEAPVLQKLCSIGATGIGMPFLTREKSSSMPGDQPGLLPPVTTREKSYSTPERMGEVPPFLARSPGLSGSFKSMSSTFKSMSGSFRSVLKRAPSSRTSCCSAAGMDARASNILLSRLGSWHAIGDDDDDDEVEEAVVEEVDQSLPRLTMAKVGLLIIGAPWLVAFFFPGSYFALLKVVTSYGSVAQTIVCPVSAVWEQRYGNMALDDVNKMVPVPFARLVFILLLLWGYFLWAYVIYQDANSILVVLTGS